MRAFVMHGGSKNHNMARCGRWVGEKKRGKFISVVKVDLIVVWRRSVGGAGCRKKYDQAATGWEKIEFSLSQTKMAAIRYFFFESKSAVFTIFALGDVPSL